jgi:hypothetical protein
MAAAKTRYARNCGRRIFGRRDLRSIRPATPPGGKFDLITCFETLEHMPGWYVGPRYGHISLLSRSALAKAWGRHGFCTGSFDDNMHLAFRTLPDFARHLAK